MIFKPGDKFTEKMQVTNEIHSGFINLFNDKNPLHTDSKFAKDNGFDGLVMHGNILNGFLSWFIGERLPAKNVIIHSQEIQFKNAVYIDDELDFTAEVSGIYESVNAVEFKFQFKKPDGKIAAKGKIQIGLLQ